MQVYLLRHGIAEESRPGVSDAERALTPEGQKKLGQVLRLASEAKVRPSLVISSPLKRALQTAEIAREKLGYNGEIARSKLLLPGSSPDDVWQDIRAHREVGSSLLLVGHNPLFTDLAAYLMGTPEAEIEFKKGAIMRIDFEAFSAQPKGKLRWYLTARLAAKKNSSHS